MIYAPMFITNIELEEIGITAEQLKKLYCRQYKDQLHTAEISENGITLQTWIDPTEQTNFDRSFAESFI